MGVSWLSISLWGLSMFRGLCGLPHSGCAPRVSWSVWFASRRVCPQGFHDGFVMPVLAWGLAFAGLRTVGVLGPRCNESPHLSFWFGGCNCSLLVGMLIRVSGLLFQILQFSNITI